MVNRVQSAPFFSIVIPTYNRKDQVLTAVQSLLDQTFSDFEIIVVDDGSKDETRAALGQINDPRLTYIYQKNSGAPTARNTGIAEAKSDYIAFLDSDDIFLPHKLETIYNEIQKFPTEAIFISSHKRIKSNKASIYYHPAKCLTPPEFQWLLHYHLIDSSTSGLVIKKTALLEKGGFDIALKCIQDRELLFRLCNDYGCVFIADVLWQKNFTEDSIVAHVVHKNYIPSLLKIVERHPKFASDFREALNYLIMRAFIKNIIHARFAKVATDFKALMSNKSAPKNVLMAIKDYKNVRKIRRSYKKSYKSEPAALSQSIH